VFNLIAAKLQVQRKFNPKEKEDREENSQGKRRLLI
jgi:hypothetical protein